MIDVEKIRRERICPICGQKISYIERKKIHEKFYLYCVHVKREAGKRKTKRCYLGPEARLKAPPPIKIASLSGEEISRPIIEQIEISKELLEDILMYYDKRRTTKMTKERKARAVEAFRKVFSKGTKIVRIETP
jgi:hypothetical protein